MLTWDATSGLYNKEFFYRAVEEALVSVEGEFDMVATDIENFKSLTERYGEAQCDILLHELAQRLVSEIDGLIAGGRIGTDLYAFLVEHRMRDWEGIIARVGDNLPVPNVNIKAGVVESLDRDLEVHQVCNRAVSALETIKGRYQVSVAYFDDELHRAQLLEQTIRDSMEAAIAEMQFSVFFQPKVVAHTGRVGGAEALVRWFHPEVGFISPGLFVPIFEKNGFITMLDLFVWEEACKEVARLRELGLPQVPISVNASRLDFDLEDLPERFAELADKYGVDHRLMHVELTETAYSDNPDVVKMLATFKELGFSTELDDFGSGYSSLVSLNTLPLDVMKLDMSMIRKATELDDFRIVESTINLARVLGLKTVVEGVETAEEAARVTEMGCDYIQGYFYSRPLRKEEFEEYLEKHIGT
jgi:EAL domain-containing protein (putative c-di-GMP-specific phosphodiesterase class I)